MLVSFVAWNSWKLNSSKTAITSPFFLGCIRCQANFKKSVNWWFMPFLLTHHQTDVCPSLFTAWIKIRWKLYTDPSSLCFLSPSPDWTWRPTSWRRFLRTRCSCGSQCTLRWRGLLSRRWCWVLVEILSTVTVSWSGSADWPGRTTWRPALHLKTWLANTSGPLKRFVDVHRLISKATKT